MSKSKQRFRRGGHHAGHLRETFTNAVYQYYDWHFANDRDPNDGLLTVEHKIDYEPVKIPMAKAFGLCWNCTDILPHRTVGSVEEILDEPLRQLTYASAARTLLAHLKTELAEINVG